MSLVNTNWLEENLEKVRIFDGSWHLPSCNRNALDEFNSAHIKNSNFFDIDKHSDHKSKLPHMLPGKNYWEKIMSEFEKYKNEATTLDEIMIDNASNELLQEGLVSLKKLMVEPSF